MDLAALRMIDANLNRAREAIRTLEDVARFAWNDRAIAEEAKSLRHALQAAVAAIPADKLACARDIAADVGTELAGAHEYARGDSSSIAIAAGKRLTEALRVVEEAAKAVDPQVARAASSPHRHAKGCGRRRRHRCFAPDCWDVRCSRLPVRA